jgi:uncharacterized protein (TIGR02118 family)
MERQRKWSGRKAMVKLITTFRLKTGFDPDESYQLWINKHVPYVKETMSPELKEYIVGRVLHTPGKGEEFFGAAQLYFDGVEDAKRALNKLLTGPEDEFMKRITDFRRVVIEERDVM